RSGAIANISDKRNGNLRTSRGWDQHALDRIEVLPEIGGVTRPNRITLARFHRSGDRFAANRRLDDVVHVTDGQTIARSGFAIYIEVEEVTANRSFGKGAPRVRKID